MRNSRHRKILTVLSLILIFGVVLTGCTGGNNKNSASGTASAPEKNEKKLDYPKKPIELIVGWAAGGGTDALARSLANIIGNSLGQPIVVVNREGANGAIATKEVAAVKGDGHKIIIDASGVLNLAPNLNDVGYKIDDFKGIAGLTYEPVILAVNANSPYKTLGDILKEKGNGKTIKYGHSGANSFPHLSQAVFYKKAGIDAKDVPFKGGAPAITALLGGHVDTIAGHPFDLVPQAQAGKIRLLGIFSPERFKDIPDLPTMKEQGYDIDMSVWKQILVQKDTPDEIVKVLEAKFAEAVKTPKFQEFLKANNLAPQILTGKEVIEKLKKESEFNKTVIEQLDLKNQK